MTDRIPLTVKVTPAEKGAMVVAAEGDIGYHEAPAFRNALREPPRLEVRSAERTNLA